MLHRPFEPFSEVLTERLRLRTPALEDAEALTDVYRDPEVGRYLGFDLITRAGDMREKLRRDLDGAQRGEGMRWVVCERGNDAPAGYVGLFHWSQRDRRAELGYVLAKHLWGRGLMKELLPALLRFGFEQMGLHRIEARVDTRNGASMRVLVRAGFRQEGLLRDHSAQPDGFIDTALFGLLEGEWRRGNAR